MSCRQPAVDGIDHWMTSTLNALGLNFFFTVGGRVMRVSKVAAH